MNVMTRNPLVRLATASVGLTGLSLVALGMAVPGHASDWMNAAHSGPGALRAFVDEKLIDCDEGPARAPIGFSRQ